MLVGAANPQFESEDKSLMMLPTDLCLIKDPQFRPWVEKYTADEDLFFRDFARAFEKLTELGCNNLQAGGADAKVWIGASLGAMMLKGLFSK